MNCQEVRQHWDLYYDSEGESELYFQINEHLDQCPKCAEWFHQQSHLEDLIVEKLQSLSPPAPTPELWKSVLASSGLERRAPSKRWYLFGGLLALAASLLVAVLLWGNRQSNGPPSPDLAKLTAQYHQQFAEGRKGLEYESRSDLDVEDYLRNRVSFPVHCPPRKDTGFLVQGAGICELDGSEAAYLVGRLDGRTVSIFILPQESLSRFPHQFSALKRENIHQCQEGRYDMVLGEINESIVLVIGQTQQERLQRVLKAYGTYPTHPHT